MKISQKRKFYEVEAIIAERVGEEGREEYEIKWKGWHHKYNTWEPIENLIKVKKMIKQFKRKQLKTRNRTSKQSKQHQVKAQQQSLNLQKFQFSQKTKSICLITPGRPTQSNRKMLKTLRQLYQTMKSKTLKDYEPFLCNQTEEKVTKTKRIKKHPKNIKYKKNIKKSKKHIPIKLAEKKQKKNKKAKLYKLAKEKQTKDQSHLKANNEENQSRMNQKMIHSKLLKDHISANHRIQSDEQQNGINEILENIKKGREIQDVMLSFRQNAHFCKFKYTQNQSEEFIELSSEQIMKMNPLWLIKFYEGYLAM